MKTRSTSSRALPCATVAISALLSACMGSSVPAASSSASSELASSSSSSLSSSSTESSSSSVDASSAPSSISSVSSSSVVASSSSESSSSAFSSSSSVSSSSAVSSSSSESSSSAVSSSSSESSSSADLAPLAQRTECPEPPPAENKDPILEEGYTFPKDEYRQLITEQEPFAGSDLTIPWALYEPEQAMVNPEQQFPMLVVLHGGYGREVEDGHILVDVAQYIFGSSNSLLTEENRAAYPTYVLMPHCTLENTEAPCVFDSNEWAATGRADFEVADQPSRSGGAAIELIEYMIENYNVDPARIYITGNSMGGGGTWDFIIRRPDLFAAAVPVTGHVPAERYLDRLAASRLPVWAFTGSLDTTNSQLDTDEAIARLQAGDGCAWQTEFNNTGHDDVLWRGPYIEPGLWPWLFEQRIPRVGEPGAGEPLSVQP